MSAEDLIPDDDVVVAMTNFGYIKRMSSDNFKSQNRGGEGIKGMQTIDEDYIEDLLMTTTHHYEMFFTNTGRVVLGFGRYMRYRRRKNCKGNSDCKPSSADAW